MKMKEEQFELIKAQLKKLTSQDCFYQKKLEGINVDDIKSQEDFEKLPFTWKGDLREAYPLGLRVVPEEEIGKNTFIFRYNRYTCYYSIYKKRY